MILSNAQPISFLEYKSSTKSLVGTAFLFGMNVRVMTVFHFWLIRAEGLIPRRLRQGMLIEAAVKSRFLMFVFSSTFFFYRYKLAFRYNGRFYP